MINSILEIQKKKKKNKETIYQKIQNRVENRIEHSAKWGKTNIIYTIPTLIFGHPSINIEEVINFLITNFEKDFVIKRISIDTLLISWDILEVEEKRKNKKMMKEKSRIEKNLRNYKKSENQKLFDFLSKTRDETIF